MSPNSLYSIYFGLMRSFPNRTGSRITDHWFNFTRFASSVQKCVEICSTYFAFYIIGFQIISCWSPDKVSQNRYPDLFNAVCWTFRQLIFLHKHGSGFFQLKIVDFSLVWKQKKYILNFISLLSNFVCIKRNFTLFLNF